MGTLSILNVYEGDMEITYDTNDAAEAIRARRIITDMIRRGYALLIEVEQGIYQRVIDFDERRGRYIIADFDPSYRPQKSSEGDSGNEQEEKPEEVEATEVPPKIRSQRGRPRRAIAMESTSAVAIARSAGG